MATDIVADQSAHSQPQTTESRRAAAREGLAPMKKEAQLQLADGTPLSGWLTSPEAFDAALAQVLQAHSRDEIRVWVEEAL